MDLQIALLLGQDGIVNGAVYGLMALALVLVFSVTRIIFIPQGEFVAFGALTLAIDRPLKDSHPEAQDYRRAAPFRAFCECIARMDRVKQFTEI